MSFGELLERVIDEGLEAARADYGSRSEKAVMLEGAVAGFEACRGRAPGELGELLHVARGSKLSAYELGARDLAWYMGYEAEIAWVCNVMSAALANSGLPTIMPPTARGVMKAAEILGVKP